MVQIGFPKEILHKNNIIIYLKISKKFKKYYNFSNFFIKRLIFTIKSL